MIIEFAKADYDQEEIDAVNNVFEREGLLASGTENLSFEKEFAEYVGSKYAVCVNSGSSANLLALAALRLPKESVVMTAACGFPATINPIIHLGLKYKLIDYDALTNNINVSDVLNNAANSQAIIYAHTLGNPVDLPIPNFPAIEDCCEAVGTKNIGKNGVMATWSFYPAHQITAGGGGGMITTDDFDIFQRLKSLRDWGKMYDWDSSLGGNSTDYSSPIQYHRGYTYTNIGYNFKLPEICAAFGRVQLRKLDKFRKIRRQNWFKLYDGLSNHPEIYIAPLSDDANPFGFCMTVKERNRLGEYLESLGIKHRPFFAGNILKQPAYSHLSGFQDPWRFRGANLLMENSLFIGCHTKLKDYEIEFMIEKIHAFYMRS